MNTVGIICRLTHDPELRHTKGGTPVADLRVAIPRKRVEGEDKGASFWTVRAWAGTAEAVCKYQKKGNKIAVDGYLDQDEWEKDGVPHQRNYIVAEPGGIEFLDRPADSSKPSETEPEPEAEPSEATEAAA